MWFPGEMSGLKAVRHRRPEAEQQRDLDSGNDVLLFWEVFRSRASGCSDQRPAAELGSLSQDSQHPIVYVQPKVLNKSKAHKPLRMAKRLPRSYGKRILVAEFWYGEGPWFNPWHV